MVGLVLKADNKERRLENLDVLANIFSHIYN